MVHFLVLLGEVTIGLSLWMWVLAYYVGDSISKLQIQVAT
jgi:hypothetical protein